MIDYGSGTYFDERSTWGNRPTDMQLEVYYRNPERYPGLADLVDVSMTQRNRRCIDGECDDCGLCRRHDRFNADRALALMSRWGKAAAKWQWVRLPTTRAKMDRLLPFGSCHRVREFPGGPIHFARVEFDYISNTFAFRRCSDGETIDAREVQVRQ